MNRENEIGIAAAIIGETYGKACYNDNAYDLGYIATMEAIQLTAIKWVDDIESLNYNWEEVFDTPNKFGFHETCMSWDDALMYWAGFELKNHFSELENVISDDLPEEFISDEYLRYQSEEGKKNFYDQVTKYLAKNFGKRYQWNYTNTFYQEAMYKGLQEMDNPIEFHFDTAMDWIIETYDHGIKETQCLEVYRNQAFRDATVIKVIGNQALIEYHMPSADRYWMNIIDCYLGEEKEDRTYKPVNKDKLPKKWQ